MTKFDQIRNLYSQVGGFETLRRVGEKIFGRDIIGWLYLLVYRVSGRRLARLVAHQSMTNDSYLARLLGMTSVEERAFLQWYAKELYTGRGIIVDLGPFLGATTCSLCRGLAANPRVQAITKPIHVFDQFTCDSFMAGVLNDQFRKGFITREYREDDSFKPEFELQTKEFEQFFTLFEGDLATMKPRREPIEFLFVDAMKNVDAANRIVNHFYTSLSPGSLIVHQDFVHYWTGWIHLIQYELRERFESGYFIRGSSSVVFRCKGDFDDLSSYRLDMAAWSETMIQDAFSHSRSMLPSYMHPNIRAAEMMLYLHRDQRSTAQRLFDQYCSSGGRFLGEVALVEKMLT